MLKSLLILAEEHLSSLAVASFPDNQLLSRGYTYLYIISLQSNLNDLTFILKPKFTISTDFFQKCE